MSLTKYAEQRVLSLFLKGSQHIQIKNVYVALYTSEITEYGDGIEVESLNTGYQRQRATFGEIEVDEDEYSIVRNNNVLDFGVATADYGMVTHMAVFDDTNNMILYEKCENPKQILKGDSLRVDIGELVIGIN